MSHTFNKQPKDPSFLRTMRRAIKKDMKENAFTMEEEANELGLTQGTLEQKLKPSADNDFTISEVMHFVEMSNDFSPLEYLANKYDFNLISKKKCVHMMADIRDLLDVANMENSDVFKVVKVSMQDGIITEEEKQDILKEIEEAEKANAELKARVLSL